MHKPVPRKHPVPKKPKLTNEELAHKQNLGKVNDLWGERGMAWVGPGPMQRVAFVRGGKTGKGKEKAIIASGAVGNSKVWVYYPKPEEALKFGKGLEKVGQYSVTKHYPGSVGVVYSSRVANDLSIDFMQGSFVQKKTPELSAWATSKHGGWRQHLLRYVFEDAIKNNVRTVTFDLPSREKVADKARQTQAKIFIEEAKKFGFTKRISRDDLIILLRPPA